LRTRSVEGGPAFSYRAVMRRQCKRCARLPVFRDHLELLEKHRQRVTYSAFAEALKTDPNSPLRDHVNDHLHCWVVTAKGDPSGYQPIEIHPDLKSRATIITSATDYLSWRANPL